MTLARFRQVTLVPNVVRKGTKLDNFVSVLKFLYFPSRNYLFYIWDRSASIYLTVVIILMFLPEKQCLSNEYIFNESQNLVASHESVFRGARISSIPTLVTRKGNDGQVGNSSTRATGYILCFEKTGSKRFYQFRPQAFLKMADDRTGRVRDVCWRLLCQLIAIDERFLCGYRLIID